MTDASAALPPDEATDTDVTGGDAVTSDEVSGATLAPEQPLGVEDPNVHGESDSLADRDLRRALPGEDADVAAEVAAMHVDDEMVGGTEDPTQNS